jgi:hypothetical protein
MKIKSAISFRKWYKNLTPARKHASQFWDENFIGAQHNDLSGFFTMYHGDKVQVYDFLRKEVEMAEDGQAIYEFVQNAADRIFRVKVSHLRPKSTFSQPSTTAASNMK